MPPPVVERLESLSSYEPVFAAGSAAASRNPVAFSHWRIPVGARTRSVLARVAFVESDFTGRPGKFAHHVLLDPAEQWPQGPAAMLLSPGVMEQQWTGEPMLLPPRLLPELNVTAAQPPAASDAPWIQTLIRQFQHEPEKPVYIVYEPGVPLLEWLNAGIGLLDQPMRWQATFSTHFTELPAGLSCVWRCVAAGTPAANAARSSTGLVIDLTRTGLAPSPSGRGLG
jgi:hypothetical protein